MDCLFSILKTQPSEFSLMLLPVFAVAAVVVSTLTVQLPEEKLEKLQTPKPLFFKNKIASDVQKKVRNMDTDLKGFKGLNTMEIEAITEKNTQLNSGNKSGQKSPRGNVLKKFSSSSLRNQNLSHYIKPSKELVSEDFGSDSTIPSLQSEGSLERPVNTDEIATLIAESSSRHKKVTFSL